MEFEDFLQDIGLVKPLSKKGSRNSIPLLTVDVYRGTLSVADAATPGPLLSMDLHL